MLMKHPDDEWLAVPPSGRFEQILLVATCPDGHDRAFVLWSAEQMDTLSQTHEAVAVLGSEGYEVPITSSQAPLELGGDYPQLFLDLQNFSERYVSPQGWFEPYEALHINLWPTQPSETYGLLGGVRNGVYEATFFPDIKRGREKIWELVGKSDSYLDFFDTFMARHLRYADNGVLPKELPAARCVDLGPRVAAWLVWWHMYRAITRRDNIK